MTNDDGRREQQLLSRLSHLRMHLRFPEALAPGLSVAIERLTLIGGVIPGNFRRRAFREREHVGAVAAEIDRPINDSTSFVIFDRAADRRRRSLMGSEDLLEPVLCGNEMSSSDGDNF